MDEDRAGEKFEMNNLGKTKASYGFEIEPYSAEHKLWLMQYEICIHNAGKVWYALFPFSTQTDGRLQNVWIQRW